MRRRTPRFNPVAAAVLRATIMRHVKELLTSAELQAWSGAHVANLVNTSGRLLFITLGAAQVAGYKEDHPDIRVCMGMGSALADLTSDSRIEQHRPAIRAGLMAIDRLLPHLNPVALFDTAAQLDAMVKSGHGLDTDDLHALVKTPERKAA
jgi:hypothetical protein